MNWELMETNESTLFSTFRAKVFGGWIVRTVEYSYEVDTVSASESSVFIADPLHEWEIGE
jgi:hypothetical protein